jgi:hypothetical protein
MVPAPRRVNLNCTTSVDPELETIVLGTLIAEPEAFREITKLEEEDFTVRSNLTLFREIRANVGRSGPPLSMLAETICPEALELIGGYSGLMAVHRSAIPGTALPGFVSRLKEQRVLRQAQRLVHEIQDSIKRGSVEDAVVASRGIAALSSSFATPSQQIRDLPSIGSVAKPVSYVREPELPEGAIVALTGQAECGKSTVATAMIRDAVIAQKRPCLILDRENPASVIDDRMKRLGLEDSILLRWFGGWVPGGEVAGPESPAVMHWARTCKPRPIILVDSMSAFYEGDENSASDMRDFFIPIRKLADLGCVCIVLHHRGRKDADYRGSTDFAAAIDQGFCVTNNGPGRRLDRITLRCFKSRYPFQGSLTYRYADGRFTPDSGSSLGGGTKPDDLTALLRVNPGIKSLDFERKALAVQISRGVVRSYLHEGLRDGLIRCQVGANNAKRYTLCAECVIRASFHTIWRTAKPESKGTRI